jgi:DNA phosphorothioation-associated putative methyltransferase
MPAGTPIKRHKAALVRNQVSRPIRLALEFGLVDSSMTVFDYGCGRGGDISRLNELGVGTQGWDPHFLPDAPKISADVVNVGYVLNVIEEPKERLDVLRDAWRLTRSTLLVTTLVKQDRRGTRGEVMADGIVTSIGTFQKHFDHSELRDLLQQTLETEPVPLALGVYCLFKNEETALGFKARRYRRRSRGAKPRILQSVKRYNEHLEILEPLMAFMREHGRLPAIEEISTGGALLDEFGSLPKAFALVRRVTGREPWEKAAQACREDILVFLALTRFGKRPRPSALPADVRVDIRRLFGAYKKACAKADEMLFGLGELQRLKKLCRSASVGKRMPEHLYVHESALSELDPLLRMYEGCARSYIGSLEDANVVKFHTKSASISYLEYAEFERNPHPILVSSVKVNLASRRVVTRDYAGRENPPVLHRKELFLAEDHPLREKFARLTQKEIELGLLARNSAIGTLQGWEQRLEERGYALKGHRVVKRKP